MFVFSTYSEIQKHLKKYSGTLGLVPTMGSLHDGHLSLVQKACNENDHVVVSVFINPTQFNNTNDLKKYPRNLAKDQELLNSINENIIFYTPDSEDLYPDQVIAKSYDFGSIAVHMEGSFRPGHFNGVATVVEALLRKFKPNRAYFGQKDFQQLRVIQLLNSQLDLGVEIIGCPTVRENDGLAMSSRNQLLNNKERKAAALIYYTLKKLSVHKNHKNVDLIEAFFIKNIEKEKCLKLEYFFVANPKELIPVKEIMPNKTYWVYVSVYAGKTRLIDNKELKRI
jgi:pantoate--beta-alanine ligase